MRTRLCQKVPGGSGDHLGTDVYLPDKPGRYPVLIVRTPYNRVNSHGYARSLTERGYAMVVQDCRGKFGSDGEFVPFVNEGEDGRALVDWVAGQSWCDGNIGMCGRSYVGMVQMPVAGGGHPALKAIAPSVYTGEFFTNCFRYNGALTSNATGWTLLSAASRCGIADSTLNWDAIYRQASLADIEALAGYMPQALREVVAHDVYDDYWRGVDHAAYYPDVKAAGFHSTGWWDKLNTGTINSWRAVKTLSKSEAARGQQRLLIGPWPHPMTALTKYGDMEYGPEAGTPITDYEHQFFDYYLKGFDNGFSRRSPVTVFLMGANRWVGLNDWPPPGAVTRTWYLESGGSANMLIGDGRLVEEAPAQSAADQFRFDPRQPVPTLGGPQAEGPVNQQPILNRPDVLVYRSAPLPRELTVMGPITLRMWAASSALDTDWIAKLCVQEATGAVLPLLVGNIRCRYRQGYDQAVPLVPDEPTALTLELGNTAYVFPKGARLVLLLTSSDFPRLYTSTNTMAPPLDAKAGANPVVARNTIMHGPGTQSTLELTCVE